MANQYVSDPPRFCQVETCSNIHYGKGYCHKHYMQLRRYGKILERTKFDANEFVDNCKSCKIYLYNKYHEKIAEAIIDSEDKKKAMLKKWNLDAFGYVGSGSMPRTWLSRYVMNAPEGYDVDHINHDRLDNRKVNLRIATRSENLGNKRKTVKTKSGLKGVFWKARDKKWVSKITFNYNRIYVGTFDDKYEAAQAYDKKAISLFGDFALTNLKLGLLK